MFSHSESLNTLKNCLTHGVPCPHSTSWQRRSIARCTAKNAEVVTACSKQPLPKRGTSSSQSHCGSPHWHTQGVRISLGNPERSSGGGGPAVEDGWGCLNRRFIERQPQTRRCLLPQLFLHKTDVICAIPRPRGTVIRPRSAWSRRKAGGPETTNFQVRNVPLLLFAASAHQLFPEPPLQESLS